MIPQSITYEQMLSELGLEHLAHVKKARAAHDAALARAAQPIPGTIVLRYEPVPGLIWTNRSSYGYPTRRCAVCRTPIEHKRANARFCGDTCSKRARRTAT